MRVVFSISLIPHSSLITLIFLCFVAMEANQTLAPEQTNAVILYLDTEECKKEQIKELHVIKQLLHYNKYILRYAALSNSYSLSLTRTHARTHSAVDAPL